MPGGEFAVSWAGGLPVICAPREIDAGNAGRLRDALCACAGQGQATLVVDMSATAFCDSSGLHQLVRAHRQAAAAGGEVRLVIGAAPVLRVFAITGADQLFPVYADVNEAVAGPLPPGAHPQEPAGRSHIED